MISVSGSRIVVTVDSSRAVMKADLNYGNLDGSDVSEIPCSDGETK